MLVTASLLPLRAARPQTAAKPEDAGRTVYDATCRRCHGAEGHDGNAPWLIPFRWNYAQALDIVRHGGPCGMPAYSASQLSDEEVKHIVDYLKTFN